MASNVEIIKAAREILEHLDHLLIEEANEVRYELMLILDNEKNIQPEKLSDEIVECLSYYEPTRSWMNNRLSTSATRGGAKNIPENQDTPRLYPVWFGTNREPLDSADLSKGFKGTQNKVAEKVYYGRCDVEVPKAHRFGEIGRSWWRRWATLDFDGSDTLKLDQIYTAKNADTFWGILNNSFLENEVSDRDALVFIHGFNTSFEDAALRAAQIGFDLKVNGHTAFFSWPSKGDGILSYASDGRSINVSGLAIANFLTDFAQKSGAERIHLVAHSMGNRGLLKALNKIMDEVKSSDLNIKFGQIILAAPDLDADLFTQAKEAYLSLSQSTTIYTSARDIPVWFSQKIHQYPRLGFVPPITTVKGIDTIQVDNFNIFSLFGHGYFAEAEALLTDIYDLISHGNTAENRQRPIIQETKDGETYWLIDT